MKAKQKKLQESEIPAGANIADLWLADKINELIDSLSSLEERVTKVEMEIDYPDEVMTNLGDGYKTYECVCKYDGNGVLRKRTPIQPKEDTKELRRKIERIIVGRELGCLFEDGGDRHNEDLTHDEAIDKILALVNE